MFSMLKRSLFLIFVLGFSWFIYLVVSILYFPVGSLADRADAAIVLGAGIHNARPSPVFAERIHHATALYQGGRVNKLIFTGGIGDKKAIAESIVARNYAIDLGIDPADIYIESKSRTTKQNLSYALDIVERENFNNLLIVSDPLHLKRSMMIADDLGMNAKASGTPTSRYQKLKTRLPFALREAYYYNQYLVLSRW